MAAAHLDPSSQTVNLQPVVVVVVEEVLLGLVAGVVELPKVPRPELEEYSGCQKAYPVPDQDSLSRQMAQRA